MTTNDFGENFWESPDNPFHNVLGEDDETNNEITERTLELGQMVQHLNDAEADELHLRVHDVIGHWLKTRVANNEIDVCDEARMASSCISNTMVAGFEQMMEETEEISTPMLLHFARCCIQVGYAIRQEQDNGELFI